MMNTSGYLIIETHTGYPDEVRIFMQTRKPSLNDQSKQQPQTRYVTFFKSAYVAQMRVHERLRHSLIDLNTRRYHTSLLYAIATTKACTLSQEHVWLDHSLSENDLNQIERFVQQEHQHQRRVDQIFKLVGSIAAGLLALTFGGTLA